MNKFYVIDPKTKRALSGPHGEGHLTLPAGMQLWDGSEADGYCVINNANGGKAMVGTLTLRGGDFIWTSDKTASNLDAGFVYGPSSVRPALGNDPTHSPFLHSVDAKTLNDQATLYFKDSDTWEDSTLAKEAEEADKPDDLYGRLRY